MVLLHGLGSAQSTWDPLLPRLAEDFQVVTVDLPGHGDSPRLPRTEPPTPRRMARLVTATLAELGVTRPHLVGNSLGGWVALEMAADGDAASVLGLAPAGLWQRPRLRPNPLLHVNRSLARLTSPLHPRLLAVPALRAVGFASVSAFPAELDEQVAVDGAAAMSHAPGYFDLLHATTAQRFDRAHAVGPDVAVTVVFGDRDYVLPASRCQNRALAPAHARWVVLEHCGHVPQWDAPGTVVRLLRDMVAAPARGR